VSAHAPRRSPGTTALFVAILIAFGIEIVTGAWQNGFVLTELGAIERYRILHDGQWWRLVSAMFLHGDGTIKGTLLHLAVNLWALFQLGTMYEVMFGTRRFLWTYFVSGIVASITSMIVTGGPSVGASGAIFGLLGAFVFSVRRSPMWRHNPVAKRIAQQCIFWIVLNIAVTSQMPQIDNAAHIGGLIAGLILGYAIPHRMPPPPPAQVVVDVMPYEG